MPSATDNNKKTISSSNENDTVQVSNTNVNVGATCSSTTAATTTASSCGSEATTVIGGKEVKDSDHERYVNNANEVDDGEAADNADKRKESGELTVNDSIKTSSGDTDDIKLPDSVVGSKKEAALRELVVRTGFPINQSNGQRRFGPPPDWEGSPPPRGCEVFVGKIPRDLFEDELVPTFEKVGEIYELRLMMDFSGNNRGYAFVVYKTKAEARQCIKQLNNYEVRQGRTIGVCSSVDNCRLFIGGIPKTIKKEEIMTEMSKITDGVVDVIVYPSASDKSKNRGFAFVEYTNHRAAAMARRKLMNSNSVELWGHKIAVDWAEPEIEVDDEVMNQVKIVYVRNLLLSTTEEMLRETFQAISTVERVKKIRDYAFVHFATKEGARMAIEEQDGKPIDGSIVEVTLAKPVDREHHRQLKNSRIGQQDSNCSLNPALQGYHPGAFPNSGYNPRISPYGQLNAAGVRISNRNQANSPRGRGRTAAGRLSAGALNSNFHRGNQTRYSNNSKHSNTSNKKYSQDGHYEQVPTVVTSNMTNIKHQVKTSVQLLEEHCAKNQLPNPNYQLYCVPGPNNIQLYGHKIIINGIMLVQDEKYCRTIEESKLLAADIALQQLGLYNENPYTMSPNRLPTAETANSYPNYIPISSAQTTGVPPKVTGPNWTGVEGAPMFNGYESYPTVQVFPRDMYQY